MTRDAITLEVVSVGPSNSIRSDLHPILESGNISFPEGRYMLDFQPGENRCSCTLTHRLENAGFISELVESRRAQYACVVSSPISCYRMTHLSPTAQQLVTWQDDDLGEPPFFTPMILCTERVQGTLDAAKDGLHTIWDGQEVTLQKGTRLAVGSIFQLEASITHLLSLVLEQSLCDGQFVVSAETEHFKFRVKLANDLFRFLQIGPTEVQHNIMTHVVTACLAYLQREFSNDDEEAGWRAYSNLIAFADFLEHRNLGHWADDGFQPEKVATKLYPLKVITPEINEDESE